MATKHIIYIITVIHSDTKLVFILAYLQFELSQFGASLISCQKPC